MPWLLAGDGSSFAIVGCVHFHLREDRSVAVVGLNAGRLPARIIRPLSDPSLLLRHPPYSTPPPPPVPQFPSHFDLFSYFNPPAPQILSWTVLGGMTQ